jgi:nucleotide-binding universal stress UspA family protein
MTQDTIVVGVDESPQARVALRWAADTARSSGSRLVGVHVLQWPQARDLYAYSVVADQVYPDPSELEAMYRTPSEHVFAEIDPEPGWTLRFAQGHAGHILVEESRDARMLVLGAREHTGLMRLLSGSIGHYCLSHAVCPIVSVPGGVPDEASVPAEADDVPVVAPQS